MGVLKNTLAALCYLAIANVAAISTASADQALLVISGKISKPNQGKEFVLDQALLDSLPQTIVKTETPWTKGMITFGGVSLGALLAAAGAEGTVLRAIALNDYAVEIPASDASDPRVIVASTMDGERMRIRDKGPLWIIYPLTDEAEYRGERTYSKMIWQLSRIDVQ